MHLNGRASSGRASPSGVTSPAGSVARHSSTSSPARSHSRTPPHRTNLVRSHSHSASSTHSQTVAPESPAGSGSEGHECNKYTSHDGDGTNDKSVASTDDEAPEDDEHQAGDRSDSTSSSSNAKEAKESDGETEGSTSQSSQSSSESDGEMPVLAAMPSNEMGENSAKKEAKTSAPSSSQPPPNTDSKAIEAELKCQQCKDTQHLDKHFGMWHNHMISKDCAGWKEHDEMCCEHGEPSKELQNRDSTGPPLDYMKQHGVFKAKKTNKYDLCRFYPMELSGNLPPFPSPHEPATHMMLEDLLRAAWALGHPNLLKAFARDSTTVVCLLQELRI